ncbi:baseplate J/gp47 family protein [Belliella sp. DSM 107340]|uniref:Baseplate J/gp47 family protein n=1 Tax=Belliella calami TaxID=2923436 RepID=A0ABS9URX6_9BACT|nr:baseplate J/gp47 family protein [Belliella calami]MCH7399180.1 baseplate J/gp47 family protein [Belliella calami]
MSSSDSKILSILKRNGSSQSSRYRKDLDPDQLELMGFGVEDWILFAYNFAQKLNFYNNNNEIEGNWDKFFQEFDLNPSKLIYQSNFDLEETKTQLRSIISQYQINGELSPHLTLFVSFLNVLETSRSKFNQLTKKHLDFYYTEVLKMEKLPPSSDSVYVILELAKNALNQRIEAQTRFNAGKNKDGKPLLYVNPEESSINSIAVKSIKNIYHDRKRKKIKQSILLDENDGQSETLKKKQSWWTFGNADTNDVQSGNPTIGFVVSSNILHLNEGKRTIILTFSFASDIKFSFDQFILFTEIYITTEKEWTQVDNLHLSKVGDLTNPFALKIEFASSFPPIAPFLSDDLIFDKLNSFPSIKFIFDTSSPVGYEIFQELNTNELKNLKIQVTVEGVKNIHLENDQTILNPQKPFYPFTTRPFKGSSFSFSYPEAFGKKCTRVELKFDWKNTPEDFFEHYETYVEEAKSNISSNIFILHQMSAYKFNDLTIKLLNDLDKKEIEATSEQKRNLLRLRSRKANKKIEQPEASVAQTQSENQIVNGNSYFKYKYEIIQNGIAIGNQSNSNSILFNPGEDNNFSFACILTNQIDKIPNAKVRVNLQQSFLHEIFPKIYAMVLTSDKDDKIIPNEPYTPLGADLTLSYSAEVDFSNNSEMNRIIHIHPFGFGDQDNKCLLSSQYHQDGFLFIGLENAKPRDILSLLFQLDEGTENPLSVDMEPIQWAILSNNTWQDLPKESILLNETSNFLRTGIVKIELPSVINTNNTSFAPDLLWIRAQLLGAHDAVCRCINIHSQAVRLQALDSFQATHLPGRLENGVISKFEKRVSQFKSVSQPYASFGGRGLENDSDFYRRVSERLRHKNRAVTQWDYEHLILEAFPDLILVKCLNHTRPTCFNAPGHVTIVVVPSIKQIDTEKIVYPRVSSGKLEEIKIFVSKFISPAMEIHVINPEYEKLSVTVNIKIHQGLDFNFYQNQLKKDITNFLSPWAFENNVLLNFNKEFHKSQILYFIENLNYIDYISKLELRLDNKPIENAVRATSPSNIIVSDESHLVSPSIDNCSKV